MLHSYTQQTISRENIRLADLHKRIILNYIVAMDFAGQSKKEVGAIGEEVASEFLRRKGFRILEKNYRKPWGEIDIIAVKSDIVRFVEVKSVSREPNQDISRENNEHRPEEMVHEHKLRKIARTAEMYMNDKNDPREYLSSTRG